MRTAIPKMFNVARVPGYDCDKLTTPHPDSPFSRAVTVFVRDWVYAVNVLHEDGSIVDFESIEDRLFEIALDVEARLEAGETALPVGLLTPTNRDTWAAVCAL